MEIVLVVLKFIEGLAQRISSRLITKVYATDLLYGDIPLQGHGETAGTAVRVTVLH